MENHWNKTNVERMTEEVLSLSETINADGTAGQAGDSWARAKGLGLIAPRDEENAWAGLSAELRVLARRALNLANRIDRRG